MKAGRGQYLSGTGYASTYEKKTGTLPLTQTAKEE